MGISNKFPGDADVPGPGTPLSLLWKDNTDRFSDLSY